MKVVKPLPPAEQVTLPETLKYGPSARVRQRAHAIYLSSKGFKSPQLIAIFEVDRDTLSSWLDQWEQQGLIGVYDAPRAGRPPRYTPAEQQRLVDLVNEKPQRLIEVQARLDQETGKAASRRTLNQVLKKPLSWEAGAALAEGAAGSRALRSDPNPAEGAPRTRNPRRDSAVLLR